MDVVDGLIWLAAILGWVFYAGYCFGVTRGKTIHNHYNVDHGHFNVMAGATFNANLPDDTQGKQSM